MNLGSYVIPVFIAVIVTVALFKKVKIFDAFLQGAGEGISSTFSILPSLVGLIAAVTMLKSSGALDILTSFLAPAMNAIGVPSELIPLALLKPVSGSGSIAVLDNILKNHGPDGFIGKVASVLMGSTETTFYVIAVYFGAAGIKNARHAVPCALLTDLFCFVFAVLAVKFLG